jgi:hypothetical protein
MLVLALTVTVLPTQAQVLPDDPVEALKNAIRLEQRKPSSLNPDNEMLKLAAAFHKKNLQEAAAKVTSSTDLSRALLLQDWMPADQGLGRSKKFGLGGDYEETISEIQTAVRKDLANRFMKKIAGILSRGNAATQAAAANLVADTIAAAATQGDDRFVYDTLTPLARELVGASQTSPPGARAAIARALGRFPTWPGNFPEDLRDQIKKERKEAAELEEKAEGKEPKKDDEERRRPDEGGPEKMRSRAKEGRERLAELTKMEGVNVVKALRELLTPSSSPATRLGAAEGLNSLAAVAAGRDANRQAGTDRPGAELGATSTPLLNTTQRIALASQVIEAAAQGLRDDSTRVRRTCLLALLDSVGSLCEQIRIQQDYHRKEQKEKYPSPDRPWSRGDREAIRVAREEIEKLTESLRPVVRAMNDNSALFAAAVRDPDPVVREKARQFIDEVGRARRLFRDLNEVVPTESKLKPEKEKEKEKGKEKRKGEEARGPGLMGGLHLVRYEAEPPAGKDQEGQAPAGRPKALPVPAQGKAEPREGEEPRKDEGKGEKGKDEEAKKAEKSGPASTPLAPVIDETTRIMVEGLLKDPDPKARRAAAAALESVGQAAVPFVPQLVRALNDRDLFVRWIVARTLGKLKARPDIAVPALAQRLCEPDLSVRVAVAVALGNFEAEGRAAVPALARWVNRGDFVIRQAAMESLEKIGKAALPALTEVARALGDDSPAVRSEAARVLGRFGPDAGKYLPALRPLLEDPSPEVRKAVSEAILNITRDGADE